MDDKEEKIDGGNNDDDSEHNSKEWKEASTLPREILDNCQSTLKYLEDVTSVLEPLNQWNPLPALKYVLR